MTLGENIRNARKKLGLTQADLAEQCEIATITIRQYESNRREPRLEQLQHIARALNVEWTDLVPLDDDLNAGINQTNKKSSRKEVPAISFNATPDPEWSELEKKLIDNTITPQELDRYKELLTQGMASAHRAISAAKMRLSEYMDILNEKGQQVAVERVEELTKIPDYQRTEDK